MSGGLFFLGLIGIIFPIISLIAAIWFALSGELSLAAIFLLWFLIWDEDDEPERKY